MTTFLLAWFAVSVVTGLAVGRRLYLNQPASPVAGFGGRRPYPYRAAAAPTFSRSRDRRYCPPRHDGEGAAAGTPFCHTCGHEARSTCLLDNVHDVRPERPCK